MNLAFTVEAHIAKPVAEVFEAVADPAKLSRYFTTGGARGRLESGATVYWDFHDFPGEFPVEVLEVVPNRHIKFRWASSEDIPPDEAASMQDAPHTTTVRIDFESLEDGRTKIVIAESGWRETDAGLAASYGNCYGWTQMVCALKAYLEYGINLRAGMFT